MVCESQGADHPLKKIIFKKKWSPKTTIKQGAYSEKPYE
jgi:hypothetical protein